MVSVKGLSGGQDRKERFLYQFIPADRASAGLLEPFPLSEYEPAFQAFGRIYDKGKVFLTYGPPDMFEMLVDFPFRNVDFARYFLCSKGPAFNRTDDLLPHSLVPFYGDKRLFCLTLQSFSSLCA